MYRLTALLTTLFLIAGLAAAAPTDAASPSAAAGLSIYNGLIAPAANPQAAYAALSPVDRQSVGLATALSKVTTSTSATAVDPSGCEYLTVVVVGTAVIGTIWHWNVEEYACTNGSQVYYRWYQVWPSNVAPLWFYDTSDGFPKTYLYGWSGYTYYSEVWSQAHFQECFFGYGIGCVDNVYPWAQATIYGNLSYYYNGGT